MTDEFDWATYYPALPRSSAITPYAYVVPHFIIRSGLNYALNLFVDTIKPSTAGC